ncbi:MAG: PD-(D/E)XK nuclease family transposase, partial [Clostridia bacterium]|nr:PD-(D/E)XK nuclease family transposase [Clostridia bacterium]
SDEKIKDLEDLECHTEWKIVEMKYKKKILTDKLEIHIIELEKLENDINSVSAELLNWLSFLQNPESERVKKCMESNKEIKEAKEKLEKISEDEKMQQLAWWSEKALLEENERKSEIKQIEDGKKELEDGKKELEDGKKELEDGKKEFAKRLKDGGISIEEIIKYTHLTKEEIEKL